MSSFDIAVVKKSQSRSQVASGGSKVITVRGSGRWGIWGVENKYTVVYAWPAYADSLEPPIPHAIYIVG